jgi:hypothetical protein
MKLQHNNKHLHDCNSGLVGQQFTRLWSFDQVFGADKGLKPFVKAIYSYRIEWRRFTPPLDSWVLVIYFAQVLTTISKQTNQ